MSDDDEAQLAERTPVGNLKTRMAGMNQTEMIDWLLQKSHFRSDNKVVNYINGTMKDLGLPLILRDKILQRNKWFRRKNNYRWFATKHYEYPIFANHFHSFQIDIIDQSKEYNRPKPVAPSTMNKREAKDYRETWLAEDEEAHPPMFIGDPESHQKTTTDYTTTAKNHDIPPYIYVFQNVNTKYVRAVAMWHKSAISALGALKLIWKDTHKKVVSLVSDEEKAIGSRLVKAWLAEKKISLKLIRGDRHTALGVINRLIRTLRDMNTVEEKSHSQSTHKKYRDFSIYRISKLIYTYNHTKHDATHKIPAEADVDQKWEENWIIKKLYETEQRKRLSDYELKTGKYVRYILPKQNETGPQTKRRYSITPERFQIVRRDGFSYEIGALDGKTLIVPRWRLKLCTEDELRRHPMAETIPKELTPKRAAKIPEAHEEPAKAKKPKAKSAKVKPAKKPEPSPPHSLRLGPPESDDEPPPPEPTPDESSRSPRPPVRSLPSRSADELPEPSQEGDLDWKRDEYLINEFELNHMKGDALIRPSEGIYILIPTQKLRLIGDLDTAHGRLFIPFVSGRDVWTLVVVTFSDEVATPKFYCPESDGKQLLEGAKGNPNAKTADGRRGKKGRIPSIRADLKEYLLRNGATRVDYGKGDKGTHTYIRHLPRPDEKHRYLSFLYIADYAVTYLFNGKDPPHDEFRRLEIPAERMDKLKKDLL
jgi:hypothetical protein